MNVLPTDKEISDKLTASLPPSLTIHNNSLSNSVMLDSKEGILFIFISNSFRSNCSNLFHMIILNLSMKEKNGVSVQAIPIYFKSQLKLMSDQYFQKTKIEIIKNQYIEGLIGISIKKQSPHKHNEKIYVVKLNPESLMKQEKVQLTQVELKYSQFYKFLWHAYVPFTLLILTKKSLLVYDLQKSTYTEQKQIDFNSLKKSNKIQCHRDTQFVNMSFVNINIRKKSVQVPSYRTLIRKYQLFLADKLGRVYLLYPFICEGIVISNLQSQDFFQIKQNNHNKFIDMLEQFQLQQIESQGQDQRFFSLKYVSNQALKFQMKLKELKNNSSENQDFRSNIIKDFWIFSIQSRTVIASCMFSNSRKCNIINVTVLPTELQDCFLSQSMDASEIEQYSIAKVISDEQTDILNQIFFLKPIQNNNIYFLQDKKCYKINLEGLANHFKIQAFSHSSIVQVSKLFNSRQSKLIAINKNEDQIMLIRFNKNRFFYDCIALKGLKMTQNLKSINKQISRIFQDVQSSQYKGKKSQDPVFQKVKNLNLSDIQTKLEKFSKDFKICVENKLSRIKNLYQQLQIAKQKAEKHQKMNNELRNLINKAQKNDNQIKTLLQEKRKNASPKQKQLISRIQNLKYLLDKLNDNSKMKINLDQQIVIDFQEQAEGIYRKMKQIRQKSQKKIIELRNLTKNK